MFLYFQKILLQEWQMDILSYETFFDTNTKKIQKVDMNLPDICKIFGVFRSLKVVNWHHSWHRKLLIAIKIRPGGGGAEPYFPWDVNFLPR